MKKELFKSAITAGISFMLCAGSVWCASPGTLISEKKPGGGDRVPPLINADKKDVVLIGDSIRMSYQQYVFKKIGNRMAVWSPEENCGSTVEILKNIDKWILAHNPSIVHINVGLHDLLRWTNSVPVYVDIETYRKNVGMILDTIRAKTKSRIIWATTTYVLDERVKKSMGFQKRKNEDVIAYNAVALEECKKRNVTVNDLYGLIKEKGPESMLSADGVHLSKEGACMLGNQVAEVILAAFEMAGDDTTGRSDTGGGD